MHVDLDYIYDPDEKQKQEKKSRTHLLDRIRDMNVNTVYLQAFSDPDANGSADMVLSPKSILTYACRFI